MPSARQRHSLLRSLVGVLFAVMTWLSLTSMSVQPADVAAAVAGAVGVLALMNADLAVIAFVVVVSVPLVASNALVGAALLVVTLASTSYLSEGDIPVVVWIGLGLVSASLGPAWAVPVLAGYVLGSSTGALAAAFACVFVELVGIASGDAWIGAVYTGASRSMMSFAGMPEDLLALDWLLRSFRSIGSQYGALGDAISAVRNAWILILQPLVWAAAAAAAAALRRPDDDVRRLRTGLVAASAGVGVAFVGSTALITFAKLDPRTTSLATTALVSIVVAGGGAALWDFLLRPSHPRRAIKRTPPTRPAPQTVVAEDADIDELLRLIATAEDRIATQHTTRSVVLISDMKSFSRMTEEEGSLVTAKAIQQHRDLLLPVIERHGGSGKSTGGDGLIASFDSAEHALAAAADMQRALESYNAARHGEREILVRIGVAAGEVVLDKFGRPFVGAAVNLAARVMSLGDGGQLLVTREIADSSAEAGTDVVSHGKVVLKNISQPIEVLEILWRDGQYPRSPRTIAETVWADA